MSSPIRSVRARGLRVIRGPFVVAPPAGARVRTRLRVTAEDAAVLRAAGRHLGTLASADLAARCAEGRLGTKDGAASRRERKRALTAGSSSAATASPAQSGSPTAAMTWPRRPPPARSATTSPSIR